jgi:hypothetical protein
MAAIDGLVAQIHGSSEVVLAGDDPAAVIDDAADR